jgi:hypothetical protein
VEDRELFITSDDPTTPVKPTTAAATKTTRTIDKPLITMGDRVRWLQSVVDPRMFAFFCWATRSLPGHRQQANLFAQVPGR